MWTRQTVAGRWRVRDVAAHLLDGDLRALAAHRDSQMLALNGQPPQGYDDVTLINSLHASGVAYSQCLSPRLLTDLVEVTGKWFADFTGTLDAFVPALFPVAWAAESESQNWMDTGREYTERWHHQMQIREAAGVPLLLDDEWYGPLLSFSIRALPRTYESVQAAEGAPLNVQVGDSPWSWCLVREGHAWCLYDGAAPNPAATVRISGTDAWRLFYNAVSPCAADSILRIDGDRELGARLITARSVMV
jgi:hypothetical protein